MWRRKRRGFFQVGGESPTLHGNGAQIWYNLPTTAYSGGSSTVYSFGCPTLVYEALYNSSSTASATYSWHDPQGVSQSVTIPAGGPYTSGPHYIRDFTVSGNGSLVTGLWTDYPVTQANLSVSGAVDANIRNITAGDQPGGSAGLPMNQDTNGNVIHKVQGNQTVIVYQSGEINIASGGSGTLVKVATGGEVVPLGAQVTYSLGVSGVLSNESGIAEIALVGDSSGEVFAYCSIGNVSGFFYPYEAEKIDVYTANNDTIVHHSFYSYQATTP
jgi:hypothetical protein